MALQGMAGVDATADDSVTVCVNSCLMSTSACSYLPAPPSQLHTTLTCTHLYLPPPPSHTQGLAKSIHHARVLIRQRHIRVGKQVVNIPSFMVRVDSQKHIDFALTSPFGGGRPGRVKRKSAA